MVLLLTYWSITMHWSNNPSILPTHHYIQNFLEFNLNNELLYFVWVMRSSKVWYAMEDNNKTDKFITHFNIFKENEDFFNFISNSNWIILSPLDWWVQDHIILQCWLSEKIWRPPLGNSQHSCVALGVYVLIVE